MTVGQDPGLEDDPWCCSGGTDCAGLNQHDCEFHLPQCAWGPTDCPRANSAKTAATAAAPLTPTFGRGYKYSAPRDEDAAFMTRSKAPETFPYQLNPKTAPADMDWRDHGAVSLVRNQGQGETCWAFSTAGSVEGAMVAVGGAKTVQSLSPQYLEDCMNIPCANSSGTPDNAFAWIAAHHGGSVYSYDSYPYLDSDCIFWDPPRTCLSNGTLSPNTVKTPVVGFHHTIVSNETDLMLAVVQQPVSIAIMSSLASFTTCESPDYYWHACLVPGSLCSHPRAHANTTPFVIHNIYTVDTGGVYYDSGCEDITAEMLDHAVLLVGYGTDPKTKEDYWLVKNVSLCAGCCILFLHCTVLSLLHPLLRLFCFRSTLLTPTRHTRMQTHFILSTTYRAVSLCRLLCSQYPVL